MIIELLILNGAIKVRIYYMDINGNRELLVYDPDLSCNQPAPLKKRAPHHVKPSTIDYNKNTLAGLRIHTIRTDYGPDGVGVIQRK